MSILELNQHRKLVVALLEAFSPGADRNLGNITESDPLLVRYGMDGKDPFPRMIVARLVEGLLPPSFTGVDYGPHDATVCQLVWFDGGKLCAKILTKDELYERFNPPNKLPKDT